MSGPAREEWAVLVAQHLADAIRACREQGGDIEAKILLEPEILPSAFGRAMYAVGTVPMNRLRAIEDRILDDGLTVAEALREQGY